MAFSFSSSKLHLSLLLPILITLFLLQLSKVKSSDSICFTSTNFLQGVSDITFQGDATTFEGSLKLTATNDEGYPVENSGGRALYSSPVQLWESGTDRESSFSTSFSFVIDPPPSGDSTGDGMTFFIAPLDAQIPSTIQGGFLALFDPSTGLDPSQNQLVAVEFDIYKNEWDPVENPHLGIDVNQIRSDVTAAWDSTGVPAGSIAFARITYDAASKELSVSLTYPNVPNSPISTLSHVVDLKAILPEWVRVGFSAATGSRVETHNVLSWSFSSNLETPRRIANN